MRKLIIALILVLATSCIAFSAATQAITVSANTAKINVNGKSIGADNFNYNGTLYVPLRAISENMGMSVNWNNDIKTASISSSDAGSNSSKDKLDIAHYLLLENEFDGLYDASNEIFFSLIHNDKETTDSIKSLKSLLSINLMKKDTYDILVGYGYPDLKGLAQNYNYYHDYLTKAVIVLENYKSGKSSLNDIKIQTDLVSTITSDIFNDRKECNDRMKEILMN